MSVWLEKKKKDEKLASSSVFSLAQQNSISPIWGENKEKMNSYIQWQNNPFSSYLLSTF